jgi:hypothetical protein
MATDSSFTALPDDVLQRVLIGVALDDHDAATAACRAFRDVIRGPRFLRLRSEYGFAERRIILVGSRPSWPHRGPMEIHLAGNRGPMASMPEDLRTNGQWPGSTTDGGARLFVSTVSDWQSLSPPPYEVLAVNGSSRRWSRLAKLPRNLMGQCVEWHRGLLYVAGGEVSAPVNTLYAFNEATGLWDDLPPMPHASSMAASGIIGNELFVAGGYGVDDLALSTLQIYDISARTWRLGASLPQAQRGACGVVVDGKLYLVSTRLSVRRSTLVYDVQSNTWDQQIPPPYAPAEDLHAMYAFTHNGRIVVVYANGTAFHRGTGSDPDWYPFDLGVTSGVDHGVAGSVLLG